METVKNAFHSAEDTLTGHSTQSGEEPISGIKGEGTATDPYDAGNSSNPRLLTTEDEPKSSSPLAMNNNDTSPEGAASGDAGTYTETDKPNPRIVSTTDSNGRDTSIRGLDDQKDPISSTTQPQSQPRGSTGTYPVGLENPREQAGSPAIHKYATNESPENDNTQLSGGAVRHTSSASTGEAEAPDRAPKESHYRSTGFASEGGDFDATKPGAGKEAERLREHRGEELSERRRSSKESVPPEGEYHHGGLWTGSHKAGISVAKAKEKLHIGKSHT